MAKKTMPQADNRHQPMEAALDVLVGATAHSSTPDEWHGDVDIYLDNVRSIRYRTNWTEPTEAQAQVRIRQETIVYLESLKDQIVDVLQKLHTRSFDDRGNLNCESFVYEPRPQNGDPDAPHTP